MSIISRVRLKESLTDPAVALQATGAMKKIGSIADTRKFHAAKIKHYKRFRTHLSNSTEARREEMNSLAKLRGKKEPFTREGGEFKKRRKDVLTGEVKEADSSVFRPPAKYLNKSIKAAEIKKPNFRGKPTGPKPIPAKFTPSVLRMSGIVGRAMLMESVPSAVKATRFAAMRRAGFIKDAPKPTDPGEGFRTLSKMDTQMRAPARERGYQKIVNDKKTPEFIKNRISDTGDAAVEEQRIKTNHRKKMRKSPDVLKAREERSRLSKAQGNTGNFVGSHGYFNPQKPGKVTPEVELTKRMEGQQRMLHRSLSKYGAPFQVDETAKRVKKSKMREASAMDVAKRASRMSTGTHNIPTEFQSHVQNLMQNSLKQKPAHELLPKVVEKRTSRIMGKMKRRTIESSAVRRAELVEVGDTPMGKALVRAAFRRRAGNLAQASLNKASLDKTPGRAMKKMAANQELATQRKGMQKMGGAYRKKLGTEDYNDTISHAWKNPVNLGESSIIARAKIQESSFGKLITPMKQYIFSGDSVKHGLPTKKLKPKLSMKEDPKLSAERSTFNPSFV